MLRNLTALICGATLAMASAFAAAQGWYGALHVGKGWKNPAHMDFTVTTALPETLPWDELDGTYKADLDYDSGWGLGAALGYTFGNWRLEGELGYRASKIGDFEVQDVLVEARPSSIPLIPEIREPFVARALAALNNEGNVRITGRAKLLAGALNLYYDLPVEWAVRPYVGAGVGMVRANKKKSLTLMGSDLVQCDAMLPPDACIIRTSDRSTEWDANWQAMAGVKRAFNDRWEAALGWRYTDLKGLSFELSDGVDDEGNPQFLGGSPLTVSKSGMHSVELTLMRRF